MERFTNIAICFSSAAPESTTTLTLNSERYHVDPININSPRMKTLFSDNIFTGRCVQTIITGYRVEEKGHMPTPTLTQKVFKLVDVVRPQ